MLVRTINDEFVSRIEQSSNPGGKTSIKTNGDTVFNDPFLEGLSASDVKDHHVVLLGQIVDLLEAEILIHLFGSFFEEERLHLVQVGVVAKVSRRLGHVSQDLLHKITLIAGL